VSWRHPVRKGLSYTLATTRLPVVAIHPNPYRFVAYIDSRYTSIPNLEGIVNRMAALPARGATTTEVQRSLFDVDGIASVQNVATSAESIRDRINESIGIFRVIEFAILLLALLIAFNSSSINTDERRREHATMFAFGVRTRSVLIVTAFESVLIGILGTALGLLFGRLLLEWLMRSLIPQTLPEIELDATLSWGTVTTAVALGIVAVTLAPLLTYRKLRRMDVPSTLRVVE
jgi:putative ABC transport system permease protein